nr:alcohol dehydrogenase 1 [Quercus suber]
MTGGGVDRSVECTGSINAMISAFECVHDGWGVAVLVGVPNKDDAFETHPMNILNEKTLKELELEKFITHEVPFLEINKAFEYMLKGDGLRCIIRMDA